MARNTDGSVRTATAVARQPAASTATTIRANCARFTSHLPDSTPPVDGHTLKRNVAAENR